MAPITEGQYERALEIMDSAPRRSQQYRDARDVAETYEYEASDDTKPKKAKPLTSESEEDSSTSDSEPEDSSEEEEDEEEEEVVEEKRKKPRSNKIAKEDLFSVKDERPKAKASKREKKEKPATAKPRHGDKKKDKKSKGSPPKKSKSENKEKSSKRKRTDDPKDSSQAKSKPVEPKSLDATVKPEDPKPGCSKDLMPLTIQLPTIPTEKLAVKNFAPNVINPPVLTFRVGEKAGLCAPPLPRKYSTESGGFDLCSMQDICIPPGAMARIETHLKVGIPKGYVGLIKGRSGLALEYMLDIMAGVVDSDYEGTIGILLFNHGSHPFLVVKYFRIAQLLVVKLYDGLVASGADVPELPKLLPNQGKRGKRGFGSSGGYKNPEVKIVDEQLYEPDCSK